MVREFVCFMPLNRALRLPCKVYVFADGRRRRSMNGSPEWVQACPSAVHSILCWVKDQAVCNAGKWCTTVLITQLVSYSGPSLDSTKLSSSLRNEPLVCPWPKSVFWAASCSTCTVLVYCSVPSGLATYCSLVDSLLLHVKLSLSTRRDSQYNRLSALGS